MAQLSAINSALADTLVLENALSSPDVIRMIKQSNWDHRNQVPFAIDHPWWELCKTSP
jgi:hypothetical protein